MDRKIRLLPAPECPNCEAKMVLKRPREDQNWDPFWGCSNYPQCSETINIDFETGLPEDGAWEDE